MASAGIKILPCEFTDIEACVDIYNQAFADDPALYCMRPRADPILVKKTTLENFQKGYEGPGITYFKAIDGGTGEIVGYSSWQYPHTPDPNEPDPETAIRNAAQPPGSNDELIVEFLVKFLHARQKWHVSHLHYYLRLLVVRPGYQRRGIGTMLLEPILEIIDEAKAKTFVTASPVGLGLYLKYGWVEVDEIIIDYSRYGGEKDVKTAVLMRDPKALRICQTGIAEGQT
ncbi:hypothetical protein HYFRA_00003352 [Hymenoscyphus fraxineus]|uniref:N-acetyltransferase domain-containing protein n=1 Tax=Hymenoscyphus fraxineus TaxID=746836 RepID=A0A9N9PS97_9HELO|nr:hypothetical protein HYFRA_00003352 [Hymenoscyphus fraxineus]